VAKLLTPAQRHRRDHHVQLFVISNMGRRRPVPASVDNLCQAIQSATLLSLKARTSKGCDRQLHQRTIQGSVTIPEQRRQDDHRTKSFGAVATGSYTNTLDRDAAAGGHHQPGSNDGVTVYGMVNQIATRAWPSFVQHQHSGHRREFKQFVQLRDATAGHHRRRIGASFRTPSCRFSLATPPASAVRLAAGPGDRQLHRGTTIQGPVTIPSNGRHDHRNKSRQWLPAATPTR
jgi:hypothetical protein